jgi:hypothetical protein
LICNCENARSVVVAYLLGISPKSRLLLLGRSDRAISGLFERIPPVLLVKVHTDDDNFRLDLMMLLGYNLRPIKHCDELSC